MYHTSNTAAARKRTRDNGASQRLPSPLGGTSLTPPSSTVSVMRPPEAQLDLAEGGGRPRNGALSGAERPSRSQMACAAGWTEKASGPQARGTMSLVSPWPQGRKCRHFGRPCGQVEAKRGDANPPVEALSAQPGRPGALVGVGKGGS